MIEANGMWNTIHNVENCWVLFLNLLSACWRWQTECILCQQASAWSRACRLSDHSLGHLWLPHTHETAGFFWPVVLQLWVSDSATIKRVLCHYWVSSVLSALSANKKLEYPLWMCCLTFLVSLRLISLTSACLSAWFLAEREKKGKKETTELYLETTWKPCASRVVVSKMRIWPIILLSF